MVVEYMRQGKSPEEACLEACKRIADNNKLARLKNAQGRPSFDVKFYALDKQGRHGSACLYEEGEYAVDDGTGARLLPSAYLFKGKP